MSRKVIILSHKFALGDVVVFTGAVRDFALMYGDEFEIHVRTGYDELWKNNHYISKFHPLGTNVNKLKQLGKTYENINYRKFIYHGRNKDNMHHFIAGMHKALSTYTGLEVPVLYPTGYIAVDQKIKDNPWIEGDYWCFFAGGKADAAAKIWSFNHWEKLIHELEGLGIYTVQSGGKNKIKHAVVHGNMHAHKEISGCSVQTLGRGGLSGLINLIYHAQGVICGITGPMHLAAALNKPCVVIGGGREDWEWEAYTNTFFETRFGEKCKRLEVEHVYLHTIGSLPCCKYGCWSSLVPGRDLPQLSVGRKCRTVIREADGSVVPYCMHLIKPEHVIAGVLHYYETGILKWPQKRPVERKLVV